MSERTYSATIYTRDKHLDLIAVASQHDAPIIRSSDDAGDIYEVAVDSLSSMGGVVELLSSLDRSGIDADVMVSLMNEESPENPFLLIDFTNAPQDAKQEIEALVADLIGAFPGSEAGMVVGMPTDRYEDGIAITFPSNDGGAA